MFGSKRQRAGDRDGARWASPWELHQAGWLGDDGWPLGTLNGMLVRLPDLKQRESAMCLAPPGQGKTSRILDPALRSEAERPPDLWRSCIVADPKGELYARVGHVLRRTHTVEVWNPSQPDKSTIGFDPLSYLPRSDHEGFVTACEAVAATWLAATTGSDETASSGARDPYWVSQPLNVLKGAIAHLRGNNPHASIIDLADYLLTVDVRELHEELQASRHKQARVRAAIIADLLANEKAVSGVFSDLRDRFTICADPRVEKVMRGRSIDFQRLIDKPTIVFVQIALGAEAYLPLLSVFVATAVGELLRLGEATNGQPFAREIRVVVDELGSLRIHGLLKGLATLRGYGVGFLLATQSTAQLRRIYGPYGAQALIDAAVTKIILGGVADTDASATAEGLGMASEVVESASYRSWGRNKHYATHSERLPLMPAHELVTMAGELVVRSSQVKPMRLRMTPFDRIERIGRDMA